MKGHEPLIAMRRQGFVPSAVWLDLDPSNCWRTWPQFLGGIEWKRFPASTGAAHVQVEPGDSIPRLDLRFVVGLTCWVQGSDAHRVHLLHQACDDAGAKRVLSTVMVRDARGNPRAVSMHDTAGLFEGAF